MQTSPQILYDIEVLNLNLYGPFLWMGFNCLKATEPLRWGNSHMSGP